MSVHQSDSRARSAILGRIRRSLASKSNNRDDGVAHTEILQHLRRRERGILPARSQVERSERIKLFLDYARKASSTTDHLSSYDDLPAAVARYLRERNLPQKIRSGIDGRFSDIDWSKEPQLERLEGPSDGSDPVGLSHALGGVAETGTTLHMSGPDNPSTLNFLPETHIIVVDANDIAADYETVQDRLPKSDGETIMPRMLNMITGPSRSGDIEQTILLGAHGPRNVHVIVIG